MKLVLSGLFIVPNTSDHLPAGAYAKAFTVFIILKREAGVLLSLTPNYWLWRHGSFNTAAGFG